jgi:tRNA-(ms[2]io[6]A)-hydroxylase
MTEESSPASLLLCETPKAWLNAAIDNLDILLIDHAHCEKKAASSALNLIYRYVDHYELLQKMSRLAREELRHFEQVIKLLKQRHIAYCHLSPSGYAGKLKQLIRSYEPHQLVDRLLVGAFIEARSCERFAALVPYLDPQLQTFYQSLVKSEARHYLAYIKLADCHAKESLIPRIQAFAELEAELIMGADTEFRFHSGVPG